MEACLPGIGQEEEAVFAKEHPGLMGVDKTCVCQLDTGRETWYDKIYSFVG